MNIGTQFASVVAAAIGIGFAASVLPAVFVVAGTVAVGLALLVRDRLYILCAITAFDFLLLAKVPPLVDVGGFTLRLDDVLFVPLFFDSVMRLIHAPPTAVERSSLVRIGLPVTVFFTYVAMTLFSVARWHSAELGFALASFLRLVAASLFVIVAYTTFTTEARLRRFVWFLAFLGVAGVLLGGYDFLFYADSIVFERRTGSFMNPNRLSSLGGLLIVLAVVERRRRILGSRIAPCVFAAFGMAGIFLGKSIGSTLATVVTVGLYQIVHMRRDMLSVVRLFSGAVAAVSVFVALLFTLRTGPAQALLALQGGSFVHRLILAQAGLEIFKENPVWGVGWGMSSRQEVIGATGIGTILRSQYQEVHHSLFPDVAASSVHNVYLQFLAELGLVGAVIFAAVVLYIGFAIRAILNHCAQDSTLRGFGEYFSLCLIFLLVFWNTTTLIGGRFDSILCFISLGALSAIPRISGRSA